MNQPQAELVLTSDQQAALDAFVGFLMDPQEQAFVLEGYSGTGKSTLVKTLIERLPGYLQTAYLINQDMPEYELALTATTNKAAENFARITGREVPTIHSFLGLRVQTDYRTNTTTLIPRSADQKVNYLLFIDEASYIDKQLLQLIFEMTHQCKIVFIGDRAQLSPVKSTNTPVFHAGFKGAMLEKVVRQAEGNPIIELATMFRNTVNSGQWGSFTPDGTIIRHLLRSDFEDEIIKEFTRKDWRYLDSKVLAWTNKCVVGYNHAIASHISGDPAFQEGDYAVCNKFVSNGKVSLKTDQLVAITRIEPQTLDYGVAGHWITLDHEARFFFPLTLEARKARIKQATAEEDIRLLQRIDSQWIDLRAAYAQTVNKSQGSTYDQVFIDLDDMRRCTSGDQLARLLYVAVSRARYRVTLTGDLA